MILRSLRLLVVGVSVLSLLAGCALLAGDRGQVRPMTVMIPNAQGGGYDITARTMTNVMERAGITGHIDVFNVVGDNETVAMARLMKESGNDRLLMMMGLGMVGACYSSGSAYAPTDATPIAELTEQPEIVVVPADSPYRSITQLISAWRRNPGGVIVGGGSSIGGPNYIFPMLLAKTAAIPVRAVRYRAFSGDGEMLPALLDHRITFGASGMAEYRDQITAGQLRVLAVSASSSPSPGTPTLKGSGIDLVYENWHGVLAPPGISASARQNLTDLLTRLHGTARWRRALAANGWTDAFLTGRAFAEFLARQERLEAQVMHELDRPISG
ncbi:MAG TPA: tripartite tricarboxylate transporter substrate-binding protein [Microbacterium sp.]|uniref:Bug family tripartite tricarboxylate transporter substrate binding protein n=1 Tax=Microbacterium sp. TaxID=51671 RepID=UPI002B473185|nr:tripartite tricarboxylate transporter substrate-binding protein [Microbacterium sp.]HKT56941.1 tripartite tricarboxylate transporter substrate-binding protein [Microbacterium sp.]